MPTAPCRVSHTCPKCSLTITLVTTDKGTSFEYDVADWSRICTHWNSGSPLACPSVRPLLKGWLGSS